MSWTDWQPFGMEAHFNPRVAVGAETEPALAFWANQSDLRRAELCGTFDLAYGDHPLMRFDLHPGKPDLPTLINIHGGYWRALDKSSMDHHMADLAKAGFGVVNMNYPLCPEVTLTQILAHLDTGLDKVVAALDQAGLTQPLILIGHSAGAHMALHLSHHRQLHDRLVGVAALSGIYQTELVRALPVNDDVRLSLEEAERWNCLRYLPAKGPSYYIAVGGAEPSGWIDQSWMMAAALRERGDPVWFHGCSKLNHFNLVDCLCDASHSDGAQMHLWMRQCSDQRLAR